MTKEVAASTLSEGRGRSLIQKFLEFVSKQEVRQVIQSDIIDPLLNHIMKRVFPYIILTCVLFVLLLLVVLLTLGIVIFQPRTTPIVIAPVPGSQ